MPARRPHTASAAFLLLILALSAALTFSAAAQGIDLGDLNANTRQAHPQRVMLDSSSAVITAGKPDWLELHFHVAPGFHINSHTPHDETLIPTALKLDPASDLKFLSESYPEGTPLRLSIGAGETLSTYQGEFRVRLHLLAPKGNETLTGSLHYQACDAASCFPPRDLPLRITLSAR